MNVRDNKYLSIGKGVAGRWLGVAFATLAACGGETAEPADHADLSAAAAGSGATADSRAGDGMTAAMAAGPAGPASATPASASGPSGQARAPGATNTTSDATPAGTPTTGAPSAETSSAAAATASAGDAAPGSTDVAAAEPTSTEGAAMGMGMGTDGAGTSSADIDAIIRGDAPTDTTGTTAGPFHVEQYTSGFADKPGFLAATVYYPNDADPPFAYVVFCPGFVSYQTSIQDWGPFLASHGIVTMTIDTNSSSDSVVTRQTALTDALQSLQEENERSESPLQGKLMMSRYGLMGWSMGGGASLLNATKDASYKSVITVAEHLATAPGTHQPLEALTVPALMFAGTADTSILGLNMSQPAYERIPETTPKLLYEVQSADHFFFNTPSALDGVVGRYALAWQKVFLEGDQRYEPILLQQGPRASDFRSNLQ